MPEAILFGTRQASLNPTWKQLAEQAKELCQLEIMSGLLAAPGADGQRVLGGPAKSEMATLVQQRLASLRTDTKRGPRDYKRMVSVNPTEVERIRNLALRYRVNLKSDQVPLHQIDIPATFSYLKKEVDSPRRLSAAHDAIFDIRLSDVQDRPTAHPALPGPPPPPPPAHSKLHFRLHQVRCLDETNPEWWGSDEISFGGVAIPPNGITAPISELFVGGGFDDGDAKNYSPPRVMHTFSLQGLSYPAVFSVAIALAEKDCGGFATFLANLWAAVQGKVSEIIAKAIAAITGLPEAVTTIISNVVSIVLGWIVDWLIGLFGDDVFPVKTVTVRISSQGMHFAGSDTSSTYSVSTSAHGGSYRVSYSWQLAT